MGVLGDAVRRTVWPYLERRRREWIAELLRIAAIPAPTFAEEARARHVAQRFREAGRLRVQRDAAGNVAGVRPGGGSGTGLGSGTGAGLGEARGRAPRLMLAAHLDTVFPDGTDVTPRVVGGRVHGPGVRDDAAGLAALIVLAQAFEDCGIRGPADLVLAATVGEEGLGNLRGMQLLLDTWRDRLDAVVCVDGDLAGLVHVGIGSVRLRVAISGPGGHSWGNFGRPSAIHLMAGCIVDLAALPLPAEPRTTYNVGTVAGGVSVNTIAPSAEMALDLRSVDPAALAALERDVRGVVARRLKPAAGCRAEVTVLGTRPAASLPDDHPLVSLARGVHRDLAIGTRLEAGSTDANLPLAEGLPAVCVGVCTGGGVHTAAEFLDADSLLVGLKVLTLLVASVWDDLRMAEDAVQPEPPVTAR